LRFTLVGVAVEPRAAMTPTSPYWELVATSEGFEGMTAQEEQTP
jgi:hypothetical protein